MSDQPGHESETETFTDKVDDGTNTTTTTETISDTVDTSTTPDAAPAGADPIETSSAGTPVESADQGAPAVDSGSPTAQAAAPGGDASQLTSTIEGVPVEDAPHAAVDDAPGQAAQQAYADATSGEGPTGAEPVTDIDGTVVTQQDMPANGVWPGQAGELREEGAPGQAAQDAASTDPGTETRVAGDEGPAVS